MATSTDSDTANLFSRLIDELRPGSCLGAAVPGNLYADEFTRAIIADIPPRQKLSFLAIRDQFPEFTASRNRVFIDLTPIRGVKALPTALPTLLKRCPAGSTLVCALTRFFYQYPCNDLSRTLVLRTLRERAAKKKLQLVLILSKSVHSVQELSQIKDDTEQMIDLSFVGTSVRAVLVKSTGVYDPSLHHPYSIELKPIGVKTLPLRLSFPPASESGTTEGPWRGEDSVESGYRNVFAKANDGIMIANLTGTQRELNAKAVQLFGYTNEEFSSIPINDLLPPDQMMSFRRALIQVRKSGKAAGEIAIVKKSGRRVHVSYSASSLGGGYAVVILRDNSELKKIQDGLRQTLENLSSLFDRDPHPRSVFAGRRLVMSNAAMNSLLDRLGINRNQNTGMLDILGKKNAHVVKATQSLGPDSQVCSNDVELIASNGDGLAFQASAVVLPYEGGTAVLLTLVDITSRSRLLHDLGESHARLKLLVDRFSDAAAIVVNNAIRHVNPAFLELVKLSSETDVSGRALSSFVARRDRALLDGAIQTASKPKAMPQQLELHIPAEGGHRTIDARLVPVNISGTHGLIVYMRDVTSLKELESRWSQRASQLNTLLKIIAAAHLTHDEETVVHDALDMTMKELGFDAGAIYTRRTEQSGFVLSAHRNIPGNMLATLSHQSEEEGVTGLVVKTREPLVLSLQSYPAHVPYKALFDAEGMATVVYVPCVSGDTVISIMMLASRKQKEGGDTLVPLLTSIGEHVGAALATVGQLAGVKMAAERYRNTIDNVAAVIYTAAPQGQFAYISPAIEALTGHSVQEFYRSADLWRTLVHPDDRPTLSRRISHQAGDSPTLTLEYRILPKGKAKYRRVRESVRYVRDGEGHVVSMNGIVTDISEDSGPAEDLLRSVELKSSVLQSIQEGVAVYDTGFRYLDWNHAMEEITGIPASRVVGKAAADVTPALFTEQVRELLNRARSGERVASEDVPLGLEGSDAERFLWVRYSPLTDKTGAILGVVGIATDITNRRRLEREVRESEETLRNVLDAMGDALMISDLQGRVWEVNREFTRITGYTRVEAIGVNFPHPWVLDEEMARFVRWIAALREKNELRDYDMTWRRKDGKTVAISLNTTLLRNALGEPVAMLNIGRDISDRNRLSLEIQRKNRQIESLNRIISKANATMEFDEVFSVIAEEVRELVAFDEISVGLFDDEGRTWRLLAVSGANRPIPGDKEPVPVESSLAHLVMAERKPVVVKEAPRELAPSVLQSSSDLHSYVYLPIMVKDTLLGTFGLASRQPFLYTGQELEFLQPIADQIGALLDRVRLFERVSDDSKYIHNLLNSMDSVVFTVDENFRIAEANSAWSDFARLHPATQPDDVTPVGRHLSEIVPSPELWTTYQEVMPKLFQGEMDYFSREFNLESNGILKVYRLAITPMVINGKVTGLVFANTDVTEIKRTEEEIKRRNRDLLALNAIAASINKSLNLGEVLTEAARHVKEITGADAVLIYLRDQQRDILVLEHAEGIRRENVDRLRVLSTSGSLTGSVMVERQTVLVEWNVTQDERVTHEGRRVFMEESIESLAVIPLQSKDNVLGALDVAFKTSHHFPEPEQHLLKLIGNQLGSAIENAQLYAEVQAQVQRVTTLYELGKGLSGALDTQTILQTVYAQVARNFPMETFAYMQQADIESAPRLVYLSQKGSEAFDMRGIAGEDLVFINDMSAAIRDGNPRIIGNAQRGLDTYSALVVPILLKQPLSAALCVFRPLPESYTDAHLRLLESIANLTEIALAKALLYEDTVEKSRVIQARNKELDDFTYVVSHDLKEPLISIEGYSKILLTDYKDKVDEYGKEYLSTIVQSSIRMKGLIDDLLTLSRLGRVAESADTVPVQEVLDEILRETEFSLRERHVTIRIPPELPLVRYNRTQLGMVFRNLISNAMKFNDKTEPLLTIDVREQEHEYVFSVADNGIGISPEYFDRVFMIFQRLHRSEDYRGTGAGLTIVKKIVEKHQGRIWLESTPGTGTTVYFTVPRYAPMGAS